MHLHRFRTAEHPAQQTSDVEIVHGENVSYQQFSAAMFLTLFSVNCHLFFTLNLALHVCTYKQLTYLLYSTYSDCVHSSSDSESHSMQRMTIKDYSLVVTCITRDVL